MELYNLLATWTGWPIIIAALLLAGSFGYWVLNNRIETLKEKNELLKLELDDAKRFNPDNLLQRMVLRHKILSDELEQMISKQHLDRNQIDEKEKVIKNLEGNISRLRDLLEKANEITDGAFCPYCFSPLKRKLKMGGTTLKEYECGGSTIEGLNLRQEWATRDMHECPNKT